MTNDQTENSPQVAGNDEHNLGRAIAILTWLGSSWRARALPKAIRKKISNKLFWVQFMLRHVQMLESTQDPLFRLNLPCGEDLLHGGIWVVEFFPPSYASNLFEALSNNGWNKPSGLGMTGHNSAERIAQARERSGFLWTDLATIASADSLHGINPIREEMPEEFSTIDVSAVQIGPSLTAIVATSQLANLEQPPWARSGLPATIQGLLGITFFIHQ